MHDQKLFMPDSTPGERLQALRDFADKTENSKYWLKLTDEEITASQETLSETMIKLDDVSERKKLATARYNAEIKSLKEIKKETLRRSRAGRRPVLHVRPLIGPFH